MKNNYSSKAFISGMVFLMLLIYLIIANYITFLNHTLFELIRRVLIISNVIAICIGMFFSAKGIKEQNTYKKIIGLIINYGIGAVCFLAIASNIYNEYFE
jgi:hypothetical protein